MATTQHLTPAGKEALRKTIRGLREALIDQLNEAAQREYRLGVSLEKAKLPEDKARKRARFEAWADEQSRADWPAVGPAKESRKKGAEAEPEAPARKRPSEKQLVALRERYLLQAVKEAAHTLLNRLVIVRILEHAGLSKPEVVTGGWKSAGYREFVNYAAALCDDARDDTKGYGALLQLLFDELSLQLPGVFGNVGLTRLFPVPAPTLREAVEALNDPDLDSAWGDDTTLGWVYQFWNDPEREALDEKINSGGKIEPHEIAPKTQMFTERYMVEWLLQNSLGQLWLAICKKHGWTPDFEGVREGLEARRVEWRRLRELGPEANGVAPDALMPLHSALEEQWKYWVPQPMPEDAPKSAPESLRDLKLLDPACGSGHFLVIAFERLGALYEEEARHRGEDWPRERIARHIVEDNLHGIDIDPRAIQIAAAAVWLKAKLFAPGVRLRRMNLVAPTFKLGALSKEDPALLRLQERLEVEVGLPRSLTRRLVEALEGVDHLGSLLRVDASIRKGLEEYEENFGLSQPKAQMGLFSQEEKLSRIQLSLGEAVDRVMRQLGRFLDAHEGDGDLGLRLEGQQLAAGVRFVQMAREGAYDVVVGNPPYQGTSKMAEADWFKAHYPRSKADLYACFLERGLEFAKSGGVSALLTMRGWMFLSSYQGVREHLLAEYDLRSIGDFDRGAFDDVPNEVLSVSVCTLRKAKPGATRSVAAQPTPFDDKSYDRQRTGRKRAAVLAHIGRHEFDVGKLAGIEGTPLVYWWDEAFLDEYVKAPKLGDVAPVRSGCQTSDNVRFLRRPWEISQASVVGKQPTWVPYVKGAAGRVWMEALEDTVRWRYSGLEVKVFNEFLYRSYTRTVKNEHWYFAPCATFSMIGNAFSARAHRFSSICDVKGSSVFAMPVHEATCLLNTERSRKVLEALNPTVSFQVGDVNRVGVFPVSDSKLIFGSVTKTFTLHESHREPSVEFKSPGRSPWRYAQDWAQRAVDRPKDAPLPAYDEQLDPLDPTSFVSFAIGVALGRFGENGEGILDLTLPSSAQPSASQPSAPRRTEQAGRRENGSSRAGAKTQNSSKDDSDDSLPEVPDITPSPLPQDQVILPEGILFVTSAANLEDSLSHPAAQRIETAWAEHGAAITLGSKGTLDDWLRKDFFAYHKGLYENRPIYFPLSSENRNFVAFISIHRWADNTLQALLANHLLPAQKKLQGEINDLNTARSSSDKKQRASAEKQYAKSQKLLEELDAFIALVTQCAEKGAPPTDPKCTPREIDAPFVMDLDDGVMINSAALWPLLLPQWKDPKKWWTELCTAQGRKDYDWAHLSARYFPKRVDEKCKHDPSLGVAHGCFWKYHPAKAYAWELRLKDEISADFTIDEVGSDEARAKFLAEHAAEAREIEAKEEQRRERNRKKAERGEEGDGDEAREDGDLEDGADVDA